MNHIYDHLKRLVLRDKIPENFGSLQLSKNNHSRIPRSVNLEGNIYDKRQSFVIGFAIYFSNICRSATTCIRNMTNTELSMQLHKSVSHY